MHPHYARADEWTKKVIGAAIEVHRLKGPGLLETILKNGITRMILPGANQP